ncbi:MAG: ribosomal L7Ae/L30e/S12e/Gadd45 family protein [Ruminococcus sp.]|nr:ribosomal L7Ae/L30e/S12e/Gadd45 family protein [Ruminococcus sp.]
MRKSSFIADSGDLPELSRHRVVVGAKQFRKALNKGCARQVFLARDADPSLTEPIMAQCQHSGVAYTWVRSMTELGRACGIEVGAAAATVVD